MNCNLLMRSLTWNADTVEYTKIITNQIKIIKTKF